MVVEISFHASNQQYLRASLRQPLPRQKKRDKHTDIRRNAWFTEALWRHNRKPLKNNPSPFEAFFNLPVKATSLSWLNPILPAHTTFT